MTTTPMPGPLALVGSGEFLPQMVDVDRWLLSGRRPRAAILPTAAGEEGNGSIQRWIKLGVDHYTAMGVEPVPVQVITEADASSEELAALLADVGLIYLSGGNPGYVSRVLNNSVVGEAIVAAWKSGTAIAGCSAGAMALTDRAPTVRGGAMGDHQSALGLVPNITLIPHFDQMHRWNPGFLESALKALTPGELLVGVDEDTALVGGPNEWTVMGRQTVSVYRSGDSQIYADGERVQLHS